MNKTIPRFVMIRQHTNSIYRWGVHVMGGPVVLCRNIGSAKSIAKEHGASGKWVRSMDPAGVRGRPLITYRDAEQVEDRHANN